MITMLITTDISGLWDFIGLLKKWVDISCVSTVSRSKEFGLLMIRFYTRGRFLTIRHIFRLLEWASSFCLGLKFRLAIWDDFLLWFGMESGYLWGEVSVQKTKNSIAINSHFLTFSHRGKLRKWVIRVTGINFSLPPAQLAVANCDDLIPPISISLNDAFFYYPLILSQSCTPETRNISPPALHSIAATLPHNRPARDITVISSNQHGRTPHQTRSARR